ncbi:MAG: hypothetical protein HFF08_07430 [Oscillospiraceae bacterium]|nr:hypothetical protein [Oscillospiraceae bacterium]
MFETLGFSYVGLIFLLMLFIPNILWSRKKPLGYSSETENKILVLLERIGEVSVCCCALLFSNFNLREWTSWSWWLIAAFLLMAMYELWWIRYFRGERKLSDFYSSFLLVPLAGATLPVLAFFTLGIYGKSYTMLLATVILGIGHIGIHMQHKKEIGFAA